MYGGQFHGLQSQFNIRRQTIAIIIINHIKDFPGGSNSKESACNEGNLDSFCLLVFSFIFISWRLITVL